MIRPKSARPALGIEPLEDRVVPAAAVLNAGILTVVGDATSEAISVQADAGGTVNVTVNGAAVPIANPFGGSLNRANIQLVQVSAGAGDDSIYIAQSLNNGASPTLGPTANFSLDGGAGNDVINVDAGGFNGTPVQNGAGLSLQNAIIRGNAVMDGGDGNDLLISGFGNDIMRGGNGDDTYNWDPGTLTDVWDGGAGNDTAIVNGNSGAAGDAFALTAQANGRALFQRTNLVQFSVDIGSTETIALNPDAGTTNSGDVNASDGTGVGADRIDVGNLVGVADLRSIVSNLGGGNDTLEAGFQRNAGVRFFVNGEAGNDFLRGGWGDDTLSGGAGNDALVENDQTSNDTMLGGDGDDYIQAGNGRDYIDGGAGNDSLDPAWADFSGVDRVADTVIGGPGADRFISYLRTGADDVPDTYVDFNAAEGDTVYFLEPNDLIG